MTRIVADFSSDWQDQLLERMRAVWGDQVDEINREEVPFRFFDSFRRDISLRPRRLEIADGFVCPEGYEAGWKTCKEKLEPMSR